MITESDHDSGPYRDGIYLIFWENEAEKNNKENLQIRISEYVHGKNKKLCRETVLLGKRME